MKGTHSISLCSSPGFLPSGESALLRAAQAIRTRLPAVGLPHIPGLDYCGECRPASESGRDFFDFRKLPGNELAVSVGDVSGEGMGAAFLVSGIRAILNVLTLHVSGEIAGLVEELNRVACQAAPDNIYVTLFYAHVDPRRREVRYVNAGHEPALL